MHTRNSNHKDFIQTTAQLVGLSQDPGIPQYEQLKIFLNLFNYIESNLVQFYMTEIIENPKREGSFLRLINVIHRKSKDIYCQLSKTLFHLPKKRKSEKIADLCCKVMCAINRARNEIYVIAEPYTPEELSEITEANTTAAAEASL